MLLNCDLGESFGVWSMGQDAEMMPLIDQANIACGFHASDPEIMVQTVQLAVAAGVQLGAHPAYPDLVGFGRRSMALSEAAVTSLIWYQAGALDGIAHTFGAAIQYIKPHGALNNDMMKNPALLHTVMTAVRQYRSDVALMLPATLAWEAHQAQADALGLPLIFEAYADRAYSADGQLRSRALPQSVHHDPERIVQQALGFAHQGGVYSHDGNWLAMPAQSLCVHGDTPAALAAVQALRQALHPR